MGNKTDHSPDEGRPVVDYSQPILPGEGASDYERYLHTDALLALQKTPDEWVHRDELLFQTVHQTSELWLKLATNEVAEVARLIDADELLTAARLQRRANECIRYITASLHMLEHMSPWEYMGIRRVLGHGSGFDSPGFRVVRDCSRRLGEALDGMLARRGLTLAAVYEHGREMEDVYQLVEVVMDWDELLILWRAHHLKVVQRSIGGDSIGTQGTAVTVLESLTPQSRFPELWKVRDELTRLAGL